MRHWLVIIGIWVGLTSGITRAPGAIINVPNQSFEFPTNDFVSVIIDSWQKTPKPDWYNEGGGFYWTQLTGTFLNTATNSPTHIWNCDGKQAIWLFSVPEVGLFQDYDSVGSNEAVPSHAFDAIFESGKSYQLTVGLFGGGAGGNYGMRLGATLELNLYYRDANSNRIPVATTIITNSAELFTSNTNLLDFKVTVPSVAASDAWAGKHIGIQLLSTVAPELQGGYWDLDNVRLISVVTPQLTHPTITNNQFQFILRSEPGLCFEILASTNTTLATANWTVLSTVTNITGELPFVDSAPFFAQRFYQARQLP
ncbi:MAG: hypothetical protein QM813_02485 [Verrucomicrobiota bacterium]